MRYDSRPVWEQVILDGRPPVTALGSLGAADLDGDGQAEVVAGEHDPDWPYRSRCRLMVYEQADAGAHAWWLYVLDDRFEHHDGAKIIELSPGRLGVLSHGWRDRKYVSLWALD